MAFPLGIHFPQTSEPPLIHQIKKDLLALRGQPVHLIQEQNSPIAQLHYPLFVVRSAGECPLAVSEELGQQKLGIIRIIRTVKLKVGGVLTKIFSTAGILMHELRQKAFPHARRSVYKAVQTSGRIQHGSLGTGNLSLHATVKPYKSAERISPFILRPGFRRFFIFRMFRIFRMFCIFRMFR